MGERWSLAVDIALGSSWAGRPLFLGALFFGGALWLVVIVADVAVSTTGVVSVGGSGAADLFSKGSMGVVGVSAWISAVEPSEGSSTSVVLCGVGCRSGWSRRLRRVPAVVVCRL